MRDLIRSVANNRGLYAVLILLNAPGWAAYSLRLTLPATVTSAPYYVMAGVTILTLDALVILAYDLHMTFALFEYLTDR